MISIIYPLYSGARFLVVTTETGDSVEMTETLVHFFHEASLQDESLDLRSIRTDLSGVIGETDIFGLCSFFEGYLGALHIELLSELDSVA